MFAARKTDGAVAAGPASYIEDVFSTYLYTGNGSVQTIPNGIALGSAYGGSVFFPGSGNRLTLSTNAALDLTGDFTIEFWINFSSLAATYQTIVETSQSGTAGSTMTTLFVDSTGALTYYARGSTILASSGGVVTAGSWRHIAIVKNGTSQVMYVNGASVATATSSTQPNTGYRWDIGDRQPGAGSGQYPVFGYISNFRIVKGTAVYTSAFTPPTEPLTAISGTSLLTCQTPNTVLDYSSNAFTVTVTNAVAQNGGGPFTDSTANKGGMVWLKGRSGATAHALYDTARGATFDLVSNSTAAQTTQTDGLISFNTNGFNVGQLAKLNTNAATYTSWTFRKQAKFFDVVTYTGNGVSGRTVAHNLGSVPGCIIVKCTSAVDNWNVYHRSLGNTQRLNLNLTQEALTDPSAWNNTTPTSLVFTVGNNSAVNANGATYVAYLFAHDAGGFGAAGADNVISCGSYTGNASSSGPVVTLGYEPQWVLIKGTTAATQQWFIFDTMRGIVTESAISVGEDPYLLANTSAAETSSGLSWLSVTSTGFQITSGNSNLNGNGENYIYIAIRRGPMKTPTSGTSVFSPVARTGTGSAASITGVGFPPDLVMFGPRSIAENKYEVDRLRGASEGLITNSSAAGVALGSLLTLNIGGISFSDGNSAWNQNAATYVNWFFGRAPGFFDVVCYTGTGSTRTVTHNLGVAPELVIYKARDFGASWNVYAQAITASNRLTLNATDAQTAEGGTYWNGVAPTATNLTVVSNNGINGSGLKYVAYLFASVTGVSKIGGYTGNGTNQTINCGFTAGARFVMIKRTDSTGDWYVWDTARGIVAGNDPRLSLNTTAAEVTTDDSIDPDNSGFIVNQLSATNINVSSATYIYLAIA